MAKMLFDHHTHTVFSHGKGTIEDNVKAAIQKGLKSIAITDHGPGHLTYGVKRSAIPEMREEVERLKDKYSNIEILLGIEANIVDNESGIDLYEEEKQYFDFVIAGYHYGVTKGHCIHNFSHNHGLKISTRELERKNTEMTLRALRNNDIYVLTHPGDKGPFDIEHLAACCEETNTLMEINSKHHHLTGEEIARVKDFNVQFIIGSDAHVPEAVGMHEASLQRALDNGLTIDRIVNIAED